MKECLARGAGHEPHMLRVRLASFWEVILTDCGLVECVQISYEFDGEGYDEDL